MKVPQEHTPLIFVTNDDGYQAPGMTELVKVALKFGDVVAVAPAQPQSGKSSAITVESPLFVTERTPIGGCKVFSVNGTPVDCVKLGLDVVASRKPDLVLSGINHGSNSGNSVIYSGTMGAAQEGCMLGIPSIGFSLTHHSIAADFGPGIPWVERIVAAVLTHGLPESICLNVNIPAQCEPKGMKAVRAARGYWTDEYERYETPGGRPFYWLKGNFVNLDADRDDNDEYWLSRQYISVVPVAPEEPSLDISASIADIRKILGI